MKGYKERMRDIENRASAMKEAIFLPAYDKTKGEFIGESAIRNERLEAVTPHTVFEAAGKGAATIQGTWANSLREYCGTYGSLPGDDLLASAHMAAENILVGMSGGQDGILGQVFESANLSTTEGVLMRDRMVALILPVMLQTITSRMATHIPGTFNQSEIFKVKKVAGSTFGDLTKDDVIDYDFNGQYGTMDQRFLAATGDGTEVGGAGSTTPNYFQFDTETDVGVAMPIKRKRVKIYHDRDLVAQDDGDGNIFGSFTAGSAVTVTGSVDYAAGTVNPIFSVAPVGGIAVHVGVDIDIEKDPTLIPVVDYLMDSRIVYPHETAMNCGISLQALWAMKREYGLNMEGMAMTDMRNLIAADKDRKILRDIRFFVQGNKQWSVDVSAGLYFQEHYETLRQTLLEMDATIMSRTGTSGLVGIVFDSASASLVKAMKAPNYVAPAGYKRIPQPHYIGRLFGMWDAYEDPLTTDVNKSVCFGIGNTVGEAGYVVGDCIPPLPFKHPILKDLQYSSTLWSLGYRDVHPFDGREYFMELEFTTTG